MITYILIGIAFMFCVEYFTNTKSYKRIENKMSPKLSYKEFGLGERIVT